MPRVTMPLIAGEGGGEYELIARIYDVLDDYTEVTSTIMVVMIRIMLRTSVVAPGPAVLLL